jgi:hypothetical protein
MTKNRVQSRQKLDGEIIKIRRGLAIYKIHASPFYMARILNPLRNPKYIVRSTKETSRINARIAAEELAKTIASKKENPLPPRDKTFRYFADLAFKSAKSDVDRGVRNKNYAKDLKFNLYNKSYGLDAFFGDMDIREVTVKNYADFSRKLISEKPSLSASVHSALRSTFRNVLKIALYDGIISQLPSPPKLNENKPTARPFFRFHPLVSSEQDQYQKLLKGAEDIVDQQIAVRGIPITFELRDIILFTTHTFLRPTVSELYALTHEDVTIEENPKRLVLTVRRGKTGYRVSNSMPAAVTVYQRLLTRNKPLIKPTDNLFLPKYQNRTTARSIIIRQFAYLLKEIGLEKDPFTGLKHSMYSLRHTALCMRMILSDGTVNMEVLARNAGTSQDMLSQFYLKYLPITRELARNLQNFGQSEKENLDSIKNLNISSSKTKLRKNDQK